MGRNRAALRMKEEGLSRIVVERSRKRSLHGVGLLHSAAGILGVRGSMKLCGAGTTSARVAAVCRL
jgi:hypothetical protein